MRLIYSAPALSDLEGIMDYIGRDNPVAAMRFGEGLLQTADLLESQPELGVRCENLIEGLRMFTYRGYRIYYRIDYNDKAVLLERVLHPALDIGPQTFE